MNRTLSAYLFLFLMFALGLSACGEKAPVTVAPTVTPASAGITPTSACLVPNVVGMDKARASERLLKIGLQPVEKYQEDSTAAKDSINSQEPVADTRLEPCSGDVIIVVSLGVPPKPTDTFVPPTLTPIATPIPPTATLPAFAEIGNFPQKWDGINKQYGWGEYPMILFIEDVKGVAFTGKLHWPTLRDSITEVRGQYVQDFGDKLEQSKWGYIGDYKTDKSGIWLKFTETRLLQGSNLILNGWYYAHIREDESMIGVWFSDDKTSQPGCDFLINFIP